MLVQPEQKGATDCQSNGALLAPGILPAITPAMMEKVGQLEQVVMDCDQAEIKVEHLLHAGMYARTVRVPCGTLFVGTLIQRPTTLIVRGSCWMLVGEALVLIEGYNVIPGRAGRKQACITVTDTEMTMLFPTAAKTVAEAEAEFTDEADQLLSRRQSNETITITGE